MIDAFVLSTETARTNPLLNRMLQTEPDEIIPLLTIESEPLFPLARDTLAARLGDAIEAGDLGQFDTELVAELVLRMGHSFILVPHGRVPGRTRAEMETFARFVLVPAFSAWMP